MLLIPGKARLCCNRNLGTYSQFKPACVLHAAERLTLAFLKSPQLLNDVALLSSVFASGFVLTVTLISSLKCFEISRVFLFVQHRQKLLNDSNTKYNSMLMKE